VHKRHDQEIVMFCIQSIYWKCVSARSIICLIILFVGLFVDGFDHYNFICGITCRWVWSCDFFGLSRYSTSCI